MQFKIENGSFSYDYIENILENINFEIRDGEKIAICGRNGTGKTTLLKLITGELELDSSSQPITKIDIKNIGYLKQISFTDENMTLEEELLKIYADIISMQNKLEEYHRQFEIQKPSEKEINEYTLLEQKFRDNDGYFFKKEINSSLQAFKFSDSDKHKKISEFSGGQRTKIAFIKLLLSKPDILLFDEPTNHLDIDSIEWLENYLANYKKSVVIVSHDRDFLDKIVNVVYEIEHKTTTRYVGNYTDYVRQKKENYFKLLKDYKQEQSEIKRQEDLIERFRYKATKASMVQSRIKALDKMEKLENPLSADTRTFHFNITPETASGREVLEVKNLKIGYPDLLLGEINLKVMRGERIGIIGKNGTGKSTFLKTIVGKIKQLGGEYSYGHNVKIGYFEQQASKHTSTKTVYEEYTDEFDKLTETEARNDLGCFLFTKDDVFKQLNELSGGEMVRLELLKIFKRGPNVLLLDEPTNHMDIIGKETLENILSDYNGTIIVVSHDRYFIKKVTTSILYFGENNQITYFPSGYNEYLDKRESLINNFESKQYTKDDSNKNLTQSENDYSKNKEKRSKIKKLAGLEDKIKIVEQELNELNNKINTPEIFEDVEKMLSMNSEIKNKEKELEDLMQKWLELGDE